MSNWYKTAGYIDPPPAMVKDIHQRVKQYIHGKQTGVVQEDVPVNLAGWKYGDLRSAVEKSITKIQEDMILVEEKSPELKAFMEQHCGPREKRMALALKPSHSIKLVMGLTLPSIPNGGGAAWSAPFVTLSIDIRRANQKGMRECIEHELVHFAQTYLQLATYGRDQLNHTPGHPSKSISNPTVYQGDKPNSIEQHALDDREFYTNLYDVIKAIKARVRPTSQGVPSDVVRRLMDSSPWMRALQSRAEARGKYQKAVSEIWKAVSQMTATT